MSMYIIAVTTPLKSIMVEEGSTAVFTCKGIASNHEGVNVHINDGPPAMDITTWPYNGTKKGALITGYSDDTNALLRTVHISIVASMDNNGTSVRCKFYGGIDNELETGPVYMYIPSGM